MITDPEYKRRFDESKRKLIEIHHDYMTDKISYEEHCVRLKQYWEEWNRIFNEYFFGGGYERSH